MTGVRNGYERDKFYIWNVNYRIRWHNTMTTLASVHRRSIQLDLALMIDTADSWAPIRITDIYIYFFWFLELWLDIDGWIFFFCDPNFSDMKSTTWDGNIAHQINGLTIRVKRLYMSWTRTPRNMNHDLQCFHPRNPFLTNEVFLYKYLFIFLMFNGFMDVEAHLAL